ncbi:hypothetical protein Taro_043366 [Colocasia esculenta]|uniref:Uncharacterized protein n=1 Tax=Colocasia esculenta TaxID=4460 RepID=A0A843WR83_COLES|nr:hypothetical protein [Colocasia esculenta]
MTKRKEPYLLQAFSPCSPRPKLLLFILQRSNYALGFGRDEMGEVKFKKSRFNDNKRQFVYPSPDLLPLTSSGGTSDTRPTVFPQALISRTAQRAELLVLSEWVDD